MGRIHHALLAQVSERIDAKVGGNFFQGEAGSNQLVLGIGIDAVEAGMGNRRRTNPHMHLGGPGIPQGLHQLATGGAPHD